MWSNLNPLFAATWPAKGDCWHWIHCCHLRWRQPFCPRICRPAENRRRADRHPPSISPPRITLANKNTAATAGYSAPPRRLAGGSRLRLKRSNAAPGALYALCRHRSSDDSAELLESLVQMGVDPPGTSGAVPPSTALAAPCLCLLDDLYRPRPAPQGGWSAQAPPRRLKAVPERRGWPPWPAGAEFLRSTRPTPQIAAETEPHPP